MSIELFSFPSKRYRYRVAAGRAKDEKTKKFASSACRIVVAGTLQCRVEGVSPIPLETSQRGSLRRESLNDLSRDFATRSRKKTSFDNRPKFCNNYKARNSDLNFPSPSQVPEFVTKRAIVLIPAQVSFAVGIICVAGRRKPYVPRSRSSKV